MSDITAVKCMREVALQIVRTGNSFVQMKELEVTTFSELVNLYISVLGIVPGTMC